MGIAVIDTASGVVLHEGPPLAPLVPPEPAPLVEEEPWPGDFLDNEDELLDG